MNTNKQHNNALYAIELSNKPGKDTTFQVCLPVIQTRTETEETRVISPAQRGTERILYDVEFDQGQMNHAIKNIIINAVESMPDSGSIIVKADNFTITTERDLPLSEGKYVKISIRDHGVGIPEKHLPKIFDPYFSTKEMGTQKGMGLGLATTYSIINRHGGHITV